MNWDKYFMSMAYLAAMRSKDERTKIGAVLVNPDKIPISTGYNGFPRGINDHRKERHEKGEKQHWFEHAERNAIYNAARAGIGTLGCTLYTPGVPCPECARGIIQAGIKQIITHQQWIESDERRWERSETMLAEAGVSLVAYSGPLVTITARRDDKNPLISNQGSW